MDPNDPNQQQQPVPPPPGSAYLRTGEQPVAYDNYGNPLYQHPLPPQPQSPQQQPQDQVEQPAPTEISTQKTKELHPMVVLQKGERVVAVIKRHPFGILSLYFGSAIGIIVAGVLAFVLLPGIFEQYNVTNGNTMVYLGLAIILVGMGVILTIATTVYWQNQWTVTSDSITQISQRSLFSRQVSQLSMDNLEDVTVEQSGIIPQMFNFGTLRVETAGERSKFMFPYCPNPTEYARKILEVHEQFLDSRRNIQNVP